jgi:large subunit ribosomal protein L19|tara:strand:- start:25532 stop:25906 length:375 start_codon:yes stop_codon:yes gene_type:complete
MTNTLFSKDLIKLVENKFLESQTTEKKDTVNVGNIIKVEYRIPDGDKERIQSYEGLVISTQNRSLGKSFTLRRNVDGIGVEQIFPLYSPKIASITRKQVSKVRRAKLYFIRKLRGKATRLKIKR